MMYKRFDNKMTAKQLERIASSAAGRPLSISRNFDYGNMTCWLIGTPSGWRNGARLRCRHPSYAACVKVGKLLKESMRKNGIKLRKRFPKRSHPRRV